MRRSPATSLALLVGVALVCAWGFNTIIGQRFAAGEAYQPGSTLRTDPLGAKAIHDSLNRLSGVRAVRNFQRLKKVEGAPGNTLVLLQVTPQAFAEGEIIDGDAVEAFAKAGGRVVITLQGQKRDWDVVMEAADKRRDENRKRREEQEKKAAGIKPTPDKDKDKDKDKAGKDESKKDKVAQDDKDDTSKGDKGLDPFGDEDEDSMKEAKSLHEVLGVKVHPENFVMATPEGALKLETPPGLGAERGDLPGWHARTHLTFHGDALEKWKVLGQVEGKNMLAVRQYERGSIVLSTDGYFLTNEGLYRAPAAKFIAWLMGDAKQVIFDETHLGTRENPGIMTLARRHRLHGLFFGGILLFALFVWKSSMSLVPTRDDDAPSRTVAGRGATAGLVSLLRRGIPLPQVLRKGLDAWERSTPHPSATQRARLEVARRHLPAEGVTRSHAGVLRIIYRQMCEALHSRATRPSAPTSPPAIVSPSPPAHD